MEKSSAARWYISLWKWCLDTVFPIECLGCASEGSFLCPSCLDRIPLREYQECPLCRTPYSQAGAICKKCRTKTALDGLLIAAPYKHRLVEQTIHTFKYRFITSLVKPLVALIKRVLDRNALAIPDMIVPVPLHSRRVRYRGFNQAELLARELSRDIAPGLEIPVIEPIVRTRFTKPQMKTISKQEREHNLTGAFEVRPEVVGPLVGKYIWLIDDVATTGTTLEECAKALKSAGAKTVWGIVIAR